jgi:capsid protein
MPPPVQPAAAASTSAAARSSFLKQDPNTRAQRLARALVSDIVAYNREKRDQMLAAGTLKNEFREEIRKSWEEYVAQVGLEVARSTPYFRDALNDILAKGQHVF